MKSRHVTNEQAAFHYALSSIVGCIACRKLGLFNDYVSIHHIDGRTKAACHWRVLPLCGEHHQLGQHGPARHKNKAEFEGAFGAECELLAECVGMLESSGYKGKVSD